MLHVWASGGACSAAPRLAAGAALCAHGAARPACLGGRQPAARLARAAGGGAHLGGGRAYAAAGAGAGGGVVGRRGRERAQAPRGGAGGGRAGRRAAAEDQPGGPLVPRPLLPTQRRPPASPAQCRGAQQPALSMGEAERSCGARHGRPRCLRTQRSHGGGQEVRSVRAGRACAARRGRRASGGAGRARAGRAQQPAPVPRARRARGRHGPGCRGAALVQRGHAAAAGRQQPRALARVGRHGGARPALRCAARPQRA